MLASGSCLLTEAVDQLDEPSNKINIVYSLEKQLGKRTPSSAVAFYHQMIHKWVLAEHVIYIDDSDVIKLDG